MKRFVFLFVALFCAFVLHAQNPFAKFGYYVPTATSSNGEFPEFHDLTEVVEIGSVLYNTKNKKVIGFVDQEKLDKGVSSVTTAMSIDPHCERYYWISPYAFCMNNPVRYVDPDGRDVIAHDEESRRNILNTLTEDEAKYVKFNKDGTINTRKLNRSKSESENMTALKTLANSDIKYNLMVAERNFQGESFTPEAKDGGNYLYGVTSVPNGEGSPSPDDMVYIMTSQFLSEGKQAENVAHEAYGHAYFYELSRTDKTIDPWHRTEATYVQTWNSEYNVPEVDLTYRHTNIKLEDRIKVVTNQARINYNNRNKKR